MQKLILAEDTSNIETNISSNELKEKEKKRRRLKAKKYMSSSSEEEDLHLYEENNVTREKILPAFPQKQLKILCHPTKSYRIHLDNLQEIYYVKTHRLMQKTETVIII